MQHFEGYDAEGFSFWFCDYKYNEENTVNFIVMNKARQRLLPAASCPLSCCAICSSCNLGRLRLPLALDHLQLPSAVASNAVASNAARRVITREGRRTPRQSCQRSDSAAFTMPPFWRRHNLSSSCLQVGGFLQRLDYVRKYAFGVIAILKNEEGQFPIR